MVLLHIWGYLHFPMSHFTHFRKIPSSFLLKIHYFRSFPILTFSSPQLSVTNGVWVVLCNYTLMKIWQLCLLFQNVFFRTWKSSHIKDFALVLTHNWYELSNKKFTVFSEVHHFVGPQSGGDGPFPWQSPYEKERMKIKMKWPIYFFNLPISMKSLNNKGVYKGYIAWKASMQKESVEGGISQDVEKCKYWNLSHLLW